MLGSVALAFVTQPVAAQSLQDWDSRRSSELRGAVSVTIPLGGTRRTSDSAPRLDFALQSYRPNVDDRNHAHSIQQQRSLQLQSVMSVTLEKRSKLLLNGVSIANLSPPSLNADQKEDANDTGGGNTVLYVIGGVLVLGVVGTVAFVTDIKDAGSDLIGPAD